MVRIQSAYMAAVASALAAVGSSWFGDSALSQEQKSNNSVSFKLQSEQCFTPIVDVKINGRGPYPFLLDTGAGITVLSPKLAADLAIDPKTTLAAGVGADQRIDIQFGTAREIRLSSVSVKDTPVAVAEMPRTANYVGLLGVTFLKHFAFKFDCSKRTIEIN